MRLRHFQPSYASMRYVIDSCEHGKYFSSLTHYRVQSARRRDGRWWIAWNEAVSDIIRISLSYRRLEKWQRLCTIRYHRRSTRVSARFSLAVAPGGGIVASRFLHFHFPNNPSSSTREEAWQSNFPRACVKAVGCDWREGKERDLNRCIVNTYM